MDPYENEDMPIPEAENVPMDAAAPQDEIPIEETFTPEEAASQPAPEQPQSTAYRGAGAGYRESPYASTPYSRSPYGTYSQPQYTQQRPSGHYTAPKPPKAPKKKSGFWRAALSVMLTLAIVAGGCTVTAVTVSQKINKQNQQTIAVLNQKIEDLQKQVTQSNSQSGTSISGSPMASTGGLTPGEVYARNVDSVVAISSTIRSTVYGQTTQGTSTGSGFIISEDGYVVTNHHVVENGTSITVITHQGEEYEATLIGSDSTNDVALLKVETEGLPAVTLGSSEDLIIGDMVVAIGNPLGKLTATQTVGYVSGKNREVTTDNSVINMIQTDAAINSGNSGGPLFNMRGEVVGITTAKYSGTTNSGASIEGISFAIPIDDVSGIIGDLRSFGYVTGAYLGVTVQDTDAASASLYGLPTGAYVASVVPDFAADKAGVQVKDIIIGLGEYKVSNITELTRALRHFKAGDSTIITVIRSGQTVELAITLDEKPQDLNAPAANAPSVPDEGDYDEWYEYFRKYFGENKG